MQRIRPFTVYVLASLLIIGFLAWKLAVEIFSRDPQIIALQREVHTLEQTVHTLYHVFPKTFYTRNEFALAIAYPGAVPLVRDCMVQLGQDVFVFDQTNTMIGMYRPGPNPFVAEQQIEAGYKCDTQLLDAQTQRREQGAADWEARVAPARQMVQRELEKDDPKWGRRSNQQ